MAFFIIKFCLQVIVHCEYMEQKLVHELWVTLLCLKKFLHSSIHNSNWGWGSVYLNNFIKIMFLEQHPIVATVYHFNSSALVHYN